MNAHVGGPDQDARRRGHRRFLEAPEPASRGRRRCAATSRSTRSATSPRSISPSSSSAITGEITYVDCGYSTVATARRRLVLMPSGAGTDRATRSGVRPLAAASTPSSSAAATTASSAPRILRGDGQAVCVLERRARPRRRRGHRGVPSRLSQLDGELHGQPAPPESDPRSPARGARARDRPAAARRTSCRCPTAGALPQVGGGTRRDAGGGRALLASRCATRCRPTTRCWTASPACCATCCSRRHPTSAAGCPRSSTRGRSRSGFARSTSPASATCSICSPRARATCSTAGSTPRPIKAAFGFDAVVGNFASPYTPGSAYVLLHHVFGEVNGQRGQWGHAIGGMGAITQAMARECAAAASWCAPKPPVARVVVKAAAPRASCSRAATWSTATRVVANVEAEASVRAARRAEHSTPTSARASPAIAAARARSG